MSMWLPCDGEFSDLEDGMAMGDSALHLLEFEQDDDPFTADIEHMIKYRTPNRETTFILTFLMLLVVLFVVI